MTMKPRRLRLKLFFVVFVLYCSAISTIFQTFLTSFVVDPGYENQLTSLDETLNSGIEFGYDESSHIAFNLSSDLRHKEVVTRAEICSNFEVCIDRIRETGNFATYAPVWVVWNYTSIMNDHSTVCVLNDDDYESFFVTTYVQKGSAFLESLNKFVAYYIESGIIHRKVRDRVNKSNDDVSSWFVSFVGTLYQSNQRRKPEDNNLYINCLGLIQSHKFNLSFLCV